MLDSNEWKIRIFEDGPTGQFKVYICSSYGNIRHYVSDIREGLITTEFREGEDIKPAMILTPSMMQALFTALQGQGLKPIEQSFIEGKLEATKNHLEDMRTLLKLKQGLYD